MEYNRLKASEGHRYKRLRWATAGKNPPCSSKVLNLPVLRLRNTSWTNEKEKKKKKSLSCTFFCAFENCDKACFSAAEQSGASTKVVKKEFTRKFINPRVILSTSGRHTHSCIDRLQCTKDLGVSLFCRVLMMA